MNTIGKYNLLVLGDVMLDEYLFGDYDRQSTEADIPILKKTKVEYALGGAGNVAINIKSLNSNPILVTIVGNDADGEIIKSLLLEKEIENYCFTDDDRRTTKKTRIVDSNYSQFIRIDSEDVHDQILAIEKQIIQKADSIFNTRKIDGVIIQDYNKGMITQSFIYYIQAKCQNSGLPLFVDPKAKNFELLSRCTVFKPNFREFSDYTGDKFGRSYFELSKKIHEYSLKSENIIITLAEKGVCYFSERHSGIIEGLKVENPDVSGAGDTVIAVIAILYLSGFDISEVSRLANASGAEVCKHRGISSISSDSLHKMIKN